MHMCIAASVFLCKTVSILRACQVFVFFDDMFHTKQTSHILAYKVRTTRPMTTHDSPYRAGQNCHTICTDFNKPILSP